MLQRKKKAMKFIENLQPNCLSLVRPKLLISHEPATISQCVTRTHTFLNCLLCQLSLFTFVSKKYFSFIHTVSSMPSLSFPDFYSPFLYSSSPCVCGNITPAMLLGTFFTSPVFLMQLIISTEGDTQRVSPFQPSPQARFPSVISPLLNQQSVFMFFFDPLLPLPPFFHVVSFVGGFGGRCWVVVNWWMVFVCNHLTLFLPFTSSNSP